MIDFRPPHASDRQWIYELSSASNLRSADYSFGSIYCWSHNASTQIARFQDRLLIRLCLGGRCMYSYPVGYGDVLPAVELLAEDAKANDRPFIMRGITAPLLDQVNGFFSRKPVISLDSDYSDYVYLASDLANLAGKKYHSKKNHVNRFMSEHDWRFEPIDRNNIQACRDFASLWFVNAQGDRETDFLSEIQAIRNTFHVFFDAGYEGGVIWDGDQVAAFSIGERISQDTFVTHFEKADPTVNGSYAIINQQFAKHLISQHPEIVYINREEDMGLENLRKAKQSYKPVFLVDKYTALWE